MSHEQTMWGTRMELWPVFKTESLESLQILFPDISRYFKVLFLSLKSHETWCRYVRPFVCLSVCPSVCPTVCPSLCSSVRPSGKITVGPEEPFCCSWRLQPSAGASKNVNGTNNVGGKDVIVTCSQHWQLGVLPDAICCDCDVALGVMGRCGGQSALIELINTAKMSAMWVTLLVPSPPAHSSSCSFSFCSSPCSSSCSRSSSPYSYGGNVSSSPPPLPFCSPKQGEQKKSKLQHYISQGINIFLHIKYNF